MPVFKKCTLLFETAFSVFGLEFNMTVLWAWPVSEIYFDAVLEYDRDESAAMVKSIFENPFDGTRSCSYLQCVELWKNL